MKLFIFEKPSVGSKLTPTINKLAAQENVSVTFFDKPWQVFKLINNKTKYQFEVLNYQYRYFLENLLDFPFNPDCWTYQTSSIEQFNDLVQKIKSAEEIILVYGGDRSSILTMQSIVKAPMLKEILLNKKTSWLPMPFSLRDDEFIENYKTRSSEAKLLYPEFTRLNVIYHLFYNEMDLLKPTEFLVNEQIKSKYLNQYKINLSDCQLDKTIPEEATYAVKIIAQNDKSYGITN